MKRLFLLALLLASHPVQANPVLGNPILNTQTLTSVSSVVFKSAAGYLYSLNVTAGSSAGYLMIFDSTSAPGNGTVAPELCYGVLASTSFSKDFQYPVPFLSGIVGVFSTTGCSTETNTAVPFINGQVK